MARSLTGLSPRQEQEYQDRMTARAALRLENAIAREVLRGMVEYGSAWGNPGKQAGAIAEHGDRIKDILALEYARSFDVFGQRLIDLASKAHPHRLERKEETDSLFMRIARAWILEMAAQKVTSIIGTTRRQAENIIRRETEAGYAEGAGVAPIAKRIRDAMQSEGAVMARSRSRVIARTETHNAANAAAHEAIASTGLPIRKEWVTAVDGREREAHREADGQTQDLHAPFIVGGEELMYPGDLSGSGANVINCRCAVAHVVED